MLFDTCELDFDPVTLILTLDLDMVVTNLHVPKMRSIGQRVQSYGLDKQTLTDRHTHTDKQTYV